MRQNKQEFKIQDLQCQFENQSFVQGGKLLFKGVLAGDTFLSIIHINYLIIINISTQIINILSSLYYRYNGYIKICINVKREGTIPIMGKRFISHVTGTPSRSKSLNDVG